MPEIRSSRNHGAGAPLTLNLNESPQFIKLRQIILTVLDRHPEAKADFLQEMRVLKVIDTVTT